MSTIIKARLSGSTDGLPIFVSSTAGVTTVHTGSTSTNTVDELTIWATNSATTTVTLTLEWGASASQLLQFEIPPKGTGLEPIVNGLIVQGRSAVGTTIFALASASNAIMLHGYVNRMVIS